MKKFQVVIEYSGVSNLGIIEAEKEEELEKIVNERFFTYNKGCAECDYRLRFDIDELIAEEVTEIKDPEYIGKNVDINGDCKLIYKKCENEDCIKCEHGQKVITEAKEYFPLPNDEKYFLIEFYNANRGSQFHNVSPRDLINSECFPIETRRAWHILDQWDRRDWYDWGVSQDLGWLTPEGEIVAMYLRALEK